MLSLFSTEIPSSASAQISKIPVEQIDGKQRVRVIPCADYEAGALHTMIFGAHWRSLWTTPVEMPVLDLNSFAGGLVPFEKGGGFQTMTLSFRGADGKEYRFRSLDKDPSRGMPTKLKAYCCFQRSAGSGHHFKSSFRFYCFASA